MTATETPTHYTVFGSRIPADRAQAVLDEYRRAQRPGVNETLQAVGLGSREALGESQADRDAWQQRSGGSHSTPVWMQELRVQMGEPQPYQTFDELTVSARQHVLARRLERQWCEEGTNNFLDEMGLLPVTPSGMEARRIEEFYRLFQERITAHGGTRELLDRIKAGPPAMVAAEPVVQRNQAELEGRIQTLTTERDNSRASMRRFRDQVRDLLIDLFHNDYLSDVDHLNELLSGLDLEGWSQTYVGSVTLRVSIEATSYDEARAAFDRGYEPNDSDVCVDDFDLTNVEEG